ncbi:MAG: C39 family peptidase [Parachlamydia sp.]|jgi:hypothetical protein|nr:C39 family peptidase [Parachlamydia sp.]
MIHSSKAQEIWEQQAAPFTELILSWNAFRPGAGQYIFYLSVKTASWSPWLSYAVWGSKGQASFKHAAPFGHIFQDTLQITHGKATAFRVKIVCEGNASLDAVDRLHVYTNGDAQEASCSLPSPIRLNVQGLSQMILPHRRCKDLCSPATTTAVLTYLTGRQTIDPLFLADQVWDAGFDIYGNWVFNVAESWTYLGAGWTGWVQKGMTLIDIHASLLKGVPVIVSVKGPLAGSAAPYASGHLLAVVGFEEAGVRCMDPAFPEHKTNICYPIPNFLLAWERRDYLAYLFKNAP